LIISKLTNIKSGDISILLTADHNQRQVLWMAYNMIEKIKGHLESVMTSGSLAQKELDQLQDLTK
jgi:hypothetical protein